MAAYKSALAAAGTAIGGPLGGVVGSILGSIGGLFSPGQDPRIHQYINPAIQAGDIGFLVRWVLDQPRHPRDSVLAARAGINTILSSRLGRLGL